MTDEVIQHYIEALRIRRELVELDESFKPKLADALNDLGNANYKKGFFAQAIESYLEAIALNRELVKIQVCYKARLADLLNNIGLAYRSKAMFHEAVESLEECVAIRRELTEFDLIYRPKLGNALHNLANVYYVKGSLDQAIEAYQETVQIRRSLFEKKETFKVEFLSSIILLGIASGSRGTYEDRLLIRKMRVEAKLLLEDSDVFSNPRYPELVRLVEILDSLVSEN
jgi:tetratricopeptide (TPR) repeat protein